MEANYLWGKSGSQIHHGLQDDYETPNPPCLN